jgi:osmoprotectant transport system permease protein
MATGGLVNVFSDAIDWLGDLANYRGDDGLIHLAWLHMQITLLSMVIATAIGLPIGIAFGHWRRGGPLVSLLAIVTRAVPTLGLLYILAAMPTFGVSTTTAVIALTIFAIPPILTNAWAGVSSVEPEALEAARGLGMSQREILARIELPLAVPLIGAGIRSSMLQTFATATVASYVGTPTLGTLIQLGQGSQMQNEVLGAAIAIGILAIAIDLVLAAIQRALTPAPVRTRPLKLLRRRMDVRAAGHGVG